MTMFVQVENYTYHMFCFDKFSVKPDNVHVISTQYDVYLKAAIIGTVITSNRAERQMPHMSRFTVPMFTLIIEVFMCGNDIYLMLSKTDRLTKNNV